MNRLQFLLIKLAEEASEVSQIALKTSQFGLGEKHPDLDKTNARRCHDELNDLYAIVEMLNKEFSFGFEVDAVAVGEKIGKVNKYYQYSRALGMVDFGVGI